MIKLGIVMDPISSINIKKDTSFAMLLEAQRRGYELHYMEMNDLYMYVGEGRARTQLLSVKEDKAGWYEFRGEQDIALSEKAGRPVRDWQVLTPASDFPSQDQQPPLKTLILQF